MSLSHRDDFAAAIAASFASGSGEGPRRLNVTRDFIAQDFMRGTLRHLLGLCEVIAEKIDPAAAASPVVARSLQTLREIVGGFGLPSPAKDPREVVAPLGNAPRTLAEDLLTVLVANGAGTGLQVDQLEDAFRAAFGRGGWAEICRSFKTIADELTRMGEPEFDGVMTSVMRGRDLFLALGAPRAGGPGDARQAPTG